MNTRNVRAIKVKTKAEPSRELTYEVVFFTRVNDLRSNVPDKRKMTKEMLGDGWASDHDQRHVVNDYVDDFIATLDMNSFEYTLLYEKDLQEA